MKKILIIGSKGFIGSHCVAYFKYYYDVWECDVVTDYINPKYILIDATNADYSDVFKKNTFDICINCSGAASVPDSIQNPRRDFLLNVTNVYSILDAIKKINPVCKFINLSSAAVYGNPPKLPVTENQALKPLSPYGFHKKMAEEILTQFAILHQLKTCSVRIFSAYGAGLKKQLLWDIYSKTQNNQTVDLFGTGNETRDFIHVNDLMTQLELVIKCTSFEGECINSANGTQNSVKEIAKIMTTHCGFTGDIVFSGNERKGDPIHWEADISHMKRWGYKQKVNINEGLLNYYLWAKKNG